jgi:hypothetical protein
MLYRFTLPAPPWDVTLLTNAAVIAGSAPAQAADATPVDISVNASRVRIVVRNIMSILI